MRELTQDFKASKVEIVEERQQKKEVKHIGSQRKINGHTLWEINLKTSTIGPATFKKEDVAVKGLSASSEVIEKRNKVIIKDDCIYIQALNKRNALKKFKNHF